MAASFSDQNFLSADPTFQNRVRQAAILYCTVVMGEGFGVAFHRERQTFAVQVMNNPSNFQVIFSQMVATNATVIGDATQNGTVVLTSGNAAAQAALVIDNDISNAFSSQFNSFFRTPA